MLFNPNEYPTVFLSYDEPNCESHYKHLLTLCPNAMRVHGVKGSDTAHKKIADIVNTNHVIIVDGDNRVKDDFYQKSYDITIDYVSTVLSFTAHNTINGQEYGNGGIKCWPVSLLKSMKTHENANSMETLVDFDFKNYHQLPIIGSDIIINASELQAWRAGFREGIKLLLNNGKYVFNINDIDWRNFDRLYNWMHIGTDVFNGIYAILGARYGVYRGLLKFNLHELHNFDILNKLFESTVPTNKILCVSNCNHLGEKINTIANKQIVDEVYNENKSINYKNKVKPVLRCPNNSPYDIVFISYDELNAEDNFNLIRKRFSNVKRIKNIKGIHNAHIEAAKLCTSDYFYVVDADAEVLDTFNFDYNIEFFDKPKIRVWRAKNIINDLVYGYGAIKLLPRTFTARMKQLNPDMSTSLGIEYEPIMELSNITKFNTSPFNTWRSAFRECTKLSSQTITNNNYTETSYRLNIWCTIGLERQYGNYCIDGANLGKQYGIDNKNNIDKLMLINDYNFLKDTYDRFYKNTV